MRRLVPMPAALALGSWIADVERPEPDYRSRYQLQLEVTVTAANATARRRLVTLVG